MARGATLRRQTHPVQAGTLRVGGGAPVSVQTMWKEPLERSLLADLARHVEALQRLGCELLRFAVPGAEAADLVGELARQSTLPLVADIHFDHRLALRCLEYPFAKIRINPGTLGAAWKVEELIRKAADRGVPLRIGINAGSLPAALRAEADLPAAMLKAAETEIELLERHGFDQAVFSLKASDVESTVQANLLFAERYSYPLHLGVTEAGPVVPGIVKNTVALTRLLDSGVGDTIRVSLSGGAETEILAGRAILNATGVRRLGVEIVSCPACSRREFDVGAFLGSVAGYLSGVQRPITVAVMGCPVNGPGEARRADLGVTGTAAGSVLFFKKGQIVRRVSADEAIEVFKEEIQNL